MGKKGKEKKKAFPLILILFVVVAVLAYFYFNTDSGEMKVTTKDAKYKKVMLLGIDGFDPKIAKKLMDEGKLPNFKRLAESGSFLPLETSMPPNSPVAWTSIATGRNPAKHNIFDFIRRDPNTHLPELSLSKTKSGIAGTDYESYVKTDPFWRLTTAAGIPTTIIRWPVTFPPERIEGNLLSGLGVPDIKGFLSGYSFYTDQEGQESAKSSSKIITVKNVGGKIETTVSGPKTRKLNDVVDVTAPMEITITDDGADIVVDKVTYHVKEKGWSDWIRAKFSLGFLKSTTGIFRAYLNSTDPFEMYVTTIQIDPENPIVDISSPPEYSADLAKEIGLYYTLGMPEETDGFIDDKLDDAAFLAHIAQIEGERDKMFWKEFNAFQKRESGIFAFVYDSSDRLNHVFWEQKLLDDGNHELVINDVVVEYFEKKDEFLGKILDQLDDDTLFMLFSDHGFTSFEKAVSINTWLVENGYMTMTKPLGDEEWALYQNVDWSKTKAFAVGFNSLYVNLKGREAKGIVEEQDRDALVNELVSKLEQLGDPQTGKKVVSHAYRKEDVWEGPLMHDAPDILVGFTPGYRMSWQTAIGGFTKDVITINDKKWDGDHLVDYQAVPGLFFTNIKVEKEKPSQMDIAATVLDAMGIELPSDMDGESLLS